METRKATYRFEVRDEGPEGPRAAGIAADARALGVGEIRRARCAKLYFVEGTIAPEELDLLGRCLFSDPVVERCSWRRCGPEPAARNASDTGDASGARVSGVGGGAEARPAGVGVVEVAPRPGVSDAVAAEIPRAARALGVAGVERAATGTRWEIEGEGLTEAALGRIASRLLSNTLVERWSLGEIAPAFPEAAEAAAAVETFDLAALGDTELLALSADRRMALDLAEMRAVKGYFSAKARPATDAELETLAQTWSEHCVHKTFRARVVVEAPGPHPYPEAVDGILKTYIRSVTEEIAAPWVLSAFVDNAGILEFGPGHEVSFKVETHNHPSAVEPFGGANTGLGGVMRDIMGVSARPIAGTDVLCFGPLGADPESLPEGALHPRLTARGVVAGIEDYGNKMGVPTVNGAVHFHEGYATNPLVYCGCVGLAPRGSHPRGAKAGDRVVVLGGRTGRDGIRGATFSSLSMDGSTGEVAGASVQIGNPIVQKRALDVLLEARDRGLYSAVTDCGAGGLSSAVGEMAAELGAEVELAGLGLKYPGLAPWEIWLSEAQERMVLAVPPGSMPELQKLCELYASEAWDIGGFTGDGRLIVRHRGRAVIDLDTEFLHEGIPRKTLLARPAARRVSSAGEGARADRGAGDRPDGRKALLALLGSPSIRSREPIIRLYDHEVQGGRVHGPFAGAEEAGPSDAAVIRPQGVPGNAAIVLSNGMRPDYAELDPYLGARAALDEAVRNAVAAGADPGRIAVLDNFCMGDPGRPEVMWDLLETARACRDGALELRTPFISGKDSFYNEHRARDGSLSAVPPSLLISAIGFLSDSALCPGSDLKRPGGALYLVGDFRPRFGGSVYAALFGNPDGSGPPEPPRDPLGVYGAVHRAVLEGLVEAAHDLSEGGLAVALAEMCLGGGLGAGIRIPTAAFGEGGAERFLFGESNGSFLLETERPEALEKALAALPATAAFVRIGEATEAPALAVENDDGSALFEIDLESLERAWKGQASKSQAWEGIV